MGEKEARIAGMGDKEARIAEMGEKEARIAEMGDKEARMGDLEKPDGSPRDKLQIADEALTTIATLAMSRVRSAVPCGQSGGDGIAGFFGMRSANKGVKIETVDNGAGVVVDLSVNMEYGARISDVARELQEAVRHDIEGMTGMKATQVNVHVLGLINKDSKAAASQAQAQAQAQADAKGDAKRGSKKKNKGGAKDGAEEQAAGYGAAEEQAAGDGAAEEQAAGDGAAEEQEPSDGAAEEQAAGDGAVACGLGGSEAPEQSCDAAPEQSCDAEDCIGGDMDAQARPGPDAPDSSGGE